jgi:cell division protein DivIC
MSDTKYKTKPKKSRSKISFIFLVFWVAIIGMSFVLVSNQANRYNQLRAELERLNAEITQMTQNNEALQIQIDFFDSDAYIERRARERLGMVRPNDIIIRNTAVD